MLEKLIYYNANTHSVNSGDCVKRAISLAFDLDYEYVAKLLRQTAKDYGLKYWNTSNVFEKVINELYPTGEPKVLYSDSTVGEFSLSHNEGTYIVLCGDNKSTSHLVCIIDGNIYDSWDSSDLICYKIYKINSVSNNLYSFDSQKEELKTFANTYISDLISRYNFEYGTLAVTDDSDFYTSDYAFSFTVSYLLNDINIKTGTDLIEPIEFTFSPRRNLEQNKKIVQKLCKTVITRLIKKIKAYLDEYKSQDIYEDKFENDSAGIYYRLPIWAQKLLISSRREFNWNWDQQIYRLRFQPLKQDPNQDILYIDALSITEVRKNLEYYKKTLERPDIDY